MLSNKIYFVFLFFSSALLWGQELSFESKASKTEVSVNERFSVQFVLTYGQDNVKIDKPLNLPDFEGLHQLGESTQSQMKIVNGAVYNQSGIEVILVADREGDYTIGSATIVLNGKKYKTDPIKISVKKGLKPKAQPGQRLKGAFLSAEVSDENPFINQEVILVIKLYARDYSLLRRAKNYQEPDFANLIAKYVSEKIPDAIRQELVNGQTFVSEELARYIIYPQKSGEIEIDPFGINVIISGYYGAEVVPLTSQPISLRVKNLPSGKPENFSGAVGNYKLNASLSKNETKANKAVNLEVEIIGSGNLNTLKTPSVDFSSNIESYAPKRKNLFETRPSGIKGKVVEEHILVPQYGGNYTIGPVAFNYFDPSKEKYITLQTKPFTLKVDGPEPPQPKQDSIASDAITDHQRKDSSHISSIVIPQKINEVKNKVVKSVSTDNSWIWVLGGLILLIGLFILFRRKSGKSSDKKSQKVNIKTEINQKLSNLKTLAEENNANSFYSLQEEILTVLGIHFGKTNLSDFTENSVAEKLGNSFSKEFAERWKSLLLETKQAKYANFTTRNNLMEKFNETNSLAKQFFSVK